MYIVDETGDEVASYDYDPYGKLLHTTGDMAEVNPIRYRGYYYDNDTDFYYLQSRYYDSAICRFINFDDYASTGIGFVGYNMFAYCNNNPVIYADPTGHRPIWEKRYGNVVMYTDTGTGGASSTARKDLATAASLLGKTPDELTKLDQYSYNCYGNGIGKQVITDPTGYVMGDSTRKTFEAVQRDLGGSYYVRELSSIDAPIGDNEFRVAMKCGPTDYHFIRQLSDGSWYNKSGTTLGVEIPQSLVTGDYWLAIWQNNGQVYMGDPRAGYPFYNDETIYFAVKVG